MNTETRLAEIVTALEGASIPCLVMGGHAVRYYGLSRNTRDFDLHLAPDGWDDLHIRLAAAPLFAGNPVLEGPSGARIRFGASRSVACPTDAKNGSNAGGETTSYLRSLNSAPAENRASMADASCRFWRFPI